MSGLFLNFFQIEIQTKEISIEYDNYNKYSTKEKFAILKDKFPEHYYFRDNDKILFWSKNCEENNLLGLNKFNIDLKAKPKLLSKFIEFGIIDFCKLNLTIKNYEIFRRKYTHSWIIKSPKDLLQNSIKGLIVNRIICFSPYYLFKEDKFLIGFTLATAIKNKFTWNKQEFLHNGIDIKGLEGNDERIYPNRQALKRFLESTGNTERYNQIISKEISNEKSFEIINNFAEWLDRNKTKIKLPFGLSINKIIKQFIPFENELIKSEIIWAPKRYFYSNRTDIKRLKFYDKMVKEYQPYSLELFQNKLIKIGIICPQEYQGETEGFAKKLETKLKEFFYLNKINFILKTIPTKNLNDYKNSLYDEELQKSDLIFVVVDKAHEKLPPENSPYHVCKAKLIGNGIPTQDIQIETIRNNLNNPTMNNISLNVYAKLGGTAWTIEKEDKLRNELIIGIGSTISENGQFVLGVAQIFSNDGRYIAGNVTPLSTFENYSANLEQHLYETLKPYIEEFNKSNKFRLIFHLFKLASKKYEIKAINNLKDKFSNFNFEFALVHLGYGHNFRLYYNDGKSNVRKGTYVQISNNTALLHFIEESDLPLKIELDKRSNFKSLYYLAKQVYWFSHLSHRSYRPSKKTVTIMYPSLMAKVTEELKKVDGWDFDRLKFVSEKLWFI